MPASIASASRAKASSAAPGTIGIRLVALPGAPTSNPLASAYIVDRLAPGGLLVRTVEIDNNTKSAATISVYVAAASIVRGAFAYAPGRNVNELSSWTSIDNAVPMVAAHSSIFDTITTAVPHSATSGARYAVVWAAVSARPTSGRGITLVSRVGVRMYLSVGPGGATHPHFTLGPPSAARSASGQSLVTAVVHNSGKSTLDLSGTLKLSRGPGGLHAGPFNARLGTVLAPGISEPVTIALDAQMPRGPWRARLTVSSGLLHRSSSATITFPARDASNRVPASSRFPIQLLVIIVLLAALTLHSIKVSRRRTKAS